ncbi:MAG: hypothetical protein V4635_13675 [Bacteroidota bacterium]
MKNILTILTLVGLYGCDHTPKKDVPGVPYKTEDYIQTQTITVAEPPVDTTTVLMTAQDDKKTWLCEFYVNRLVLVTRNNPDTLVVPNDYSYALKFNILLHPGKIETADKSSYVEILEETCSGRHEEFYTNTPKKINISHHKKKLQGCVSLAR